MNVKTLCGSLIAKLAKPVVNMFTFAIKCTYFYRGLQHNTSLALWKHHVNL